MRSSPCKIAGRLCCCTGVITSYPMDPRLASRRASNPSVEKEVMVIVVWPVGERRRRCARCASWWKSCWSRCGSLTSMLTLRITLSVRFVATVLLLNSWLGNVCSGFLAFCGRWSTFSICRPIKAGRWYMGFRTSRGGFKWENHAW